MSAAVHRPGHGGWFSGCAEKRARVLAGLPPTPSRRRTSARGVLLAAVVVLGLVALIRLLAHFCRT